ncbi:hypothetical protein FSP39_019949 [Pinctada imbricata]|uniref:G-protein coupled receptors family 3 profile domain-containing protein n=1 Tax=Pinctada imbricata TaxID=66713 RepID=A0AA88XKZ9_PINIB|nr:hypothetical protein FSP39_019949 [Pinctada imbricata]
MGGYACGQPHKELIQVYEAARWALERVNTQGIVPGITMGMKAYDTCSSESQALLAAQKFYPQFSHTSMACSTNSNKLNLGLLGPLSSWTTQPVAEMASSFPASVISPRAVSPSLSDKTKYPYFLRTGPAWPAQTRAIAAVLNRLVWKRVIVVYTTSVHGSDGFDQFKRQAFKDGICITKAIAVPSMGSVNDFQTRVNNLGQYNINTAVFIGSYMEAVNLMQALNNIGSANNVQWILPDLNLMESYSAPNVRGALYVGPRTVSITEFANYFTQINERSPPAENPWFSDWYMTNYNCKLPGVSYQPYVGFANTCPTLTAQQKLSNFRQLPFAETTIKAVYAYAKALHQAHQQRCGGIPGVCSSLQTMTPEEFHAILKNIDFTFAASDGISSLIGTRVKFDQNGDIITQDYTVWNYNKKRDNINYRFEEVGQYVNEQLTLTTTDIEMYDSLRTTPLGSLPTSVCPSEGCLYCIIPRDMVDFYYTPGDITLAHVLSIHTRGTEPLSCGNLYNFGLGRATAFQYAILTAKSQLGILNRVSLGGLIADICGSSETGRIFMNNVLGERHLVRDRNGQLVNHNSIKVMIEGLSSSSTKLFTTLMDQFMIPQVGYQATSRDLMDTQMYPQFTRVISGLDKLAAAIVNYLARYGWSYVQVIKSGGDFYDQSVAQFKETGALARTCVSATYEVSSDGTVAEILEKIRQKPMAKVVILYLQERDTKALLEALKSASWQRDFLLVFAQTYEAVLYQNYGNLLQGSVYFSAQNFGVTGFRNWLQTLNPRNSESIPWFREWYQYAHQCYLDVSDKGMYTTECSNTVITSGSHYEDAWFNSYSINAVYVAAKALDETLKYYCGVGYSGVCVKYRAADDSNKILLQYLHNATVTVDSTPLEMMNGEGLTGYDISAYRPNTGIGQVGSWNTKTGILTISDSNLAYPVGAAGTNFTSFCGGLCNECGYLTRGSYYLSEGDIYVASALGIHDPWIYSPFNCGDMRLLNGVQLGLAQAFAVQMINNKNAPVSLRNVTLGNLILDHCSVSTRSFDLVSYTYTGLSTMSAADKMKLDPSRIMAWISDTTDAVVSMSGPVKSVNVPFISPIASSESLSDRDDFPTFFRTVQGDLSLSTAMTKLALSLNMRYVVVVYSEGHYGESGLESFESVAIQEGVCIILKIKMSNSNQASQILDAIDASSSHLVILWTNGAHTTALFTKRAGNLLRYEDMAFVIPMPMMAIARATQQGAGKTFMLNLKATGVDHYYSFIKSLTMDSIYTNPFLLEYYMVLFQCDLPGFNFFRRPCTTPYKSLTDSTLFSNDTYVIPMINAVYSVVGAIDAVLKDKCGSDYNGICSAVSNLENLNELIMEKMETITFKDPLNRDFRYIGREGNAPMELLFWDGVNMEVKGEFAGASLLIENTILLQMLVSNVPSSCTTPCLVCIEKGIDFAYIPGDILIGGMFDVHMNSLVPFSCGSLKTQSGFQLLEAFNYAIQQVNDKSGQFANILRNVKLGGVGLDACMSTIRSGYLISDIHNGLITLTRNGQTVNPDDISLYIGGYSSDSSLYMARILSELKVPQISYASSSESLSDQFRYPYFLRTVPADDKQSLAMIRFLNAKNIRYVQVVQTPDDYGTMGAAKFNELASKEENKICVAQTIRFPDNQTVTRESSDRVVRLLLNKPVANTVVVFADQSYVKAMLEAISRNTGAIGKFHFIGSESWGNHYEAISGVEPYAVGSLTLGLEFSDIREFDFHIGQKSPGNYPENPWFPEFYEEMVNCYLTSPNGRHMSQCASATENIAAQRDYIQDPGILHVMNAVYSAAYGLDSSLKSACGENYTTVCERFKNDPNRHESLVSNILKSRFVDASGVNFEFRRDRRDGNKGYNIYNIQERMMQNEIGYAYQKIGSFSSDDTLSNLDAYTQGWDGSCERPDSCLECPSIRNVLPRVMLQPGTPSSNTLLVMYGIHNQGTDPYRCGSLDMDEFYKMLAFLFTMQRFFPNTRYSIRGMVVDTCHNSLRIDQDVYSLLSSGKLCNTVFQGDGIEISNNTIAGFLTSRSSNVVAANRVLAPRKIPILSSSATSVLLSDKVKYPYFARTVPPDNKQMDTIARILKEKGWNSPTVVYSQETYGISGASELARMASDQGTCVGYQLSIPYPGTVAQAREALQALSSNAVSNVIVLIAYDPRTVLQAAKELGILGNYIWIGSETWGNKLSVIDGMQDDLLGAITVDVKSYLVDEFRNFTAELTYNNRKNIPNAWFEEFYQMYHKCNIPSATVNFPNYPICSTSLVINPVDIISQPYVLNTIAATYAYVRSLDTIATGDCNGRTFKDCFSDSTNWERLFSRILGTTWNVNNALNLMPNPLSDVVVNFNDDRFWDTGYVINNFNQVNTSKAYRQVGSHAGSTFTFGNYMSHRSSSWSPCRPDRSCDCSTSPIVLAQTSNDTYRRTQPIEPRNYLFYNTRQETVEGRLQDVYDLVYKWPIWAIATAVPTSLGILVTIILFCYFLIAYPVRGGTTILGFMMMLGILGIYGVNFAFFLPASEATCGAREFVLGTVYAIVFAALLVKAVDNWRFTDLEDSFVRKYKGLTSACSLFMVALGIVCIQLIIPIEWLILRHPSASKMANATNIHDWMWCDPHDWYDKSMVLSMVFVMFLVLLTAIFAALAWDSDSNYYESRWILVSSVCTAGCFLVWMIVTTNAGPPYRDPAIALANFFNATAILVFMTLRKFVLMYTITDEEDEKQSFADQDRGNDLYSTVYSNQGFDDAVFQPAPSKLDDTADNVDGDVGF